MRKLLILALILSPLTAVAEGNEGRFDWSLGQPSIVEDATSPCTDTAKVRYDWSLGQPTQVFNATATCTAEAPAPAGDNPHDVFWFD